MSILCSTTDAVSSGSWPILFRVLTLNVSICIVCWHFSSFSLSSVADFSNTEAGLQPQQDAPLFTRAKSDAIYVCGLSVGHGYLSMAVLFSSILTPYRWAAVVPDRTDNLSVKLQDSHVQEMLALRIRIPSRPSCCFYVYVYKKKKSFFYLKF